MSQLLSPEALSFLSGFGRNDVYFVTCLHETLIPTVWDSLED